MNNQFFSVSVQDLSAISDVMMKKYNAYIRELDYPIVFTRSGQTAVPMHHHELIEIVYIVSGKGIQTVSKQRYPCAKGDLLLFNTGECHAVTSETGVDTIHVLMRPDYLSKHSGQELDAVGLLTLTSFREFETPVSEFLPKISFQGKQLCEVEQILYAMLQEYQEKAVGFSTVLKNELMILIIKLLRHIYQNSKIDIVSTMERIRPTIIDFIHKNYDKKITLNDLARQSCYNPSYFGQIFRKCFGITPIEYINKTRIEHAATLLTETSKTVDEIAFAVGFNDRKRFYQHFKRFIGISPGQYRKNAKKKSAFFEK